MLRLKNLSNKFQKRLLRVEYGHTQATPYAASLHSSLRNADDSFRRPLSTDTSPLTRSADAFVLKNGLVPGTVILKGEGETAVVATGANAALQPWGLLANFVGGDLDELGDENYVGVWYGKDSVYTVLKPAFDDTGLATAYSNATAGSPVKLYAGTDGRLVYNSSPGDRVAVADLIERVSASRIVIKLLV
jgi:hypothetical protein